MKHLKELWNVKLSTVHFSSWFLYLYNTIDSLHNFEKRHVTLCSHYVAGIKCTKMSCSFSWERKRWHSGGSLGWPFPKLKYKYIFQIKYTEAIYPNSTRKLFWFEISKMLNAVLKSKFIVLFIIIVGTLSFPIPMWSIQKSVPWPTNLLPALLADA